MKCVGHVWKSPWVGGRKGGWSRSERGKGKEGEKEREGGRRKERERYIAEDECVLAFGSILRDSSNFINHPSFSNLVCRVE